MGKLFNNTQHTRVKEVLHFTVHGWGKFEVEYGARTGPMAQYGIRLSIDGKGGGCFSLEDARRFGDYLLEEACLTRPSQ